MADLSISGASPLPHIESDIRINYNDPNKIIAASNCLTPPPLSACTRATPCNLQVYCSVDGGATWSRSRLPSAPSPSSESSDSGDAFQSDPAVDWTSDGTAWALTIGGSGPNEPSYVRSFIS